VISSTTPIPRRWARHARHTWTLQDPGRCWQTDLQYAILRCFAFDRLARARGLGCAISAYFPTENSHADEAFRVAGEVIRLRREGCGAPFRG
jgi:hypothetical protein